MICSEIVGYIIVNILSAKRDVAMWCWNIWHVIFQIIYVCHVWDMWRHVSDMRP